MHRVQVGWCKYLTMRPESLSWWIARLSVDDRADLMGRTRARHQGSLQSGSGAGRIGASAIDDEISPQLNRPSSTSIDRLPCHSRISHR